MSSFQVCTPGQNIDAVRAALDPLASEPPEIGENPRMMPGTAFLTYRRPKGDRARFEAAAKRAHAVLVSYEE